MVKPNTRNPPKILYKYLDPAGFIVLTSLTFRFSKLPELNDPFECKLSLTPGRFITPPTQRPEFEKLLWEYGITCFTEDPSNLLMWAHYARSHSGFVIGIDTRHPSFRSYGKLVQIIYERRRPRIDAQNFDGVLHALSTKSKEWSYEREWRVVTPLHTCQTRGKVFLKPIDPGCISELVLGVGVDDGLVNRAIKWQRNYPHVNLRRNRLDSLKYKLFADADLHHEPSLVITQKDPHSAPHLQIDMGGEFKFQLLELGPDGFLTRDLTAEVVQDATTMTEREKKRQRSRPSQRPKRRTGLPKPTL